MILAQIDFFAGLTLHAASFQLMGEGQCSFFSITLNEGKPS